MQPILIFTNLPDAASAERVAAALLEAGLAACVNILAPVTSVYTWQGKKETAQEIPLLIKSFDELYDQVEQLIQAQHPYEVPEIVSIPVARALPAYLAWMHDVTREEGNA
jgi:periplasmic divalent cation tolerance protein